MQEIGKQLIYTLLHLVIIKADLRRYPLRISASMVLEAVMRKIRKTKRSDQFATARKGS